MELNIQLLSVTGEVLYENKRNLDAGKNQLNVPMGEIAGGMYFLRLNNATGSKTLKIWVE